MAIDRERVVRCLSARLTTLAAFGVGQSGQDKLRRAFSPGAAMSETDALIAAPILERPLCLPCIALKATISETGVEASLARIAPVVRIRRELGGRCRACGQAGIVVSLIRPDVD
jgi:hypothetical protein